MPVASIQYPDDIVNRNNNGGWHKNGKRAYPKAVQGILRFLQTAKNAHLYHLCFEPLDEASKTMTSREMYKANMAMLHALVQMAEREGIQCDWWAAREIADGTKKDHIHVFMVIDATGIKVAKLFNTFEDGRVQQHCKAHGVEFNIFEPKDRQGIHGRNNFMRLPYQGTGNRQTALGGERLADALVWLSYLGKKRSKPEDDKSGQIYPASRPARTRKAAPQAAQEALGAQAATQTVPSILSVPRLEGQQITLTKELHEGCTKTRVCQANRSSSQDQSTDTSPDGRKTTSRANHCPGHDCSTSQSEGHISRYSTEAIHPGCQDDGAADRKPEAIQRGQSNGGTSSPGCNTRSPITKLPEEAISTRGTMLTTTQKYMATGTQFGGI